LNAGQVTAIISGLTLTGGYAANGGAVYAYTDSDLTLSDVTITGNHATGSGWGIDAIYGDSLVAENCPISGNSVVSYDGARRRALKHGVCQRARRRGATVRMGVPVLKGEVDRSRASVLNAFGVPVSW
jgi:hypothetical protein